MKVLLECVCRGVNDESQQVRNSALFAIGHFSEHLQVFEIVSSQPNTSKYHRFFTNVTVNLTSVQNVFRAQPDISKYSRELLPLLFNYMAKAEAAGDKDPKGLINSYYALEMFCENLGKYVKKCY